MTDRSDLVGMRVPPDAGAPSRWGTRAEHAKGDPSSTRRLSFRLLARHQLASAAATAVDFAVMTLLVELFAIAPETATFGGALIGACVNFTLNRRFTFRTAGRSRARREALRYALVSSGSALLNAAGEYAGTRWLGAPYLLVRAVVSLAVSLGWNYPLHRGFVFQAPAPRAGRILA